MNETLNYYTDTVLHLVQYTMHYNIFESEVYKFIYWGKVKILIYNLCSGDFFLLHTDVKSKL